MILPAGIKKTNPSVLCTHFASSALGLSAGFLLDVQKAQILFYSSGCEQYTDFTGNSEQILKTNFPKTEVPFSNWYFFYMNFKHLNLTNIFSAVLWKLEASPSGCQSGTPSLVLYLLQVGLEGWLFFCSWCFFVRVVVVVFFPPSNWKTAGLVTEACSSDA